jgi:hypothetical protein
VQDLSGLRVSLSVHSSQRPAIVSAGEPSRVVIAGHGMRQRFARKQFEMFSEQTKDLTALGQKMAGESVEPIARSVSQTSLTFWPRRSTVGPSFTR